MAARRGLSFLGAVISLLLAALGAGWLWLVLDTGQPVAHLVAASVLVLVSLALAARCVVHLLGTLPRPAEGEWGELHDAADPRLPRLRGEPRGPTHDAKGAACPWCGTPRRAQAEHCPSCGQAF